MLDQDLKKKIKDLLTARSPDGKPIHMATAAALLNENGIECRSNGYKKMRLLLEDLDFLEVTDVSIDGKQHTEVRLKPASSASRGRGPATLSTEQKKQLYGLFCRSFEKGVPYHLATVSKTIMDAGVDRSRLGFGKTKTFFKAMDDFVDLQEVMVNGVPQVVVTLRDVPQWEGETGTDQVIFPPEKKELPADAPLSTAESPAGKEKKNHSPKKDPAPKPEKPEKQVRPKEKGKSKEKKPEEPRLPGIPLSRYADMPAATLAHLRAFCDLGSQPDSYIRACLDEGYAACLRENTLQFGEGRIVFSTPLRDQDGGVIHASVRPSGAEGGLPWFLNYLGSGTLETRRQEPGRMLELFADVGDWNLFLEQLARTALPEDWNFGGSSYGVLRQYIQYTFYRLQLEDKVLISDDDTLAAFNTGLVDKHYDDLYACFVPNEAGEDTPEWRFAGFCTAASRGSGKRLVETFRPLPQPPSYFERKEDLLFDLEKDLHVDFHHIIIDNIHRLPLAFLQEECGQPEAQRLLARIRRARPGEKRELYDRLRDMVDDNERLFNRIRSRIEDAIDLARKQVRWNFRVAVPCFFPTRNAMSLMLPLDLDDDEKADTALVVELTRSGNYQGQTVLTMRQAYIDARLICRPTGGDWLQVNPHSAEDDGD